MEEGRGLQRSKQRWTKERNQKERTLYDEWLLQQKQESTKAAKERQPSAPSSSQQQQVPRRSSITPRSSQYGDTAAQPSLSIAASSMRGFRGTDSGSTIRAVSPDRSVGGLDTVEDDDETGIVPERGTTSFEQNFLSSGSGGLLGSIDTPETTGSPGQTSLRSNGSRTLRRARDFGGRSTSPTRARSGAGTTGLSLHRIGMFGRSTRDNSEQRTRDRSEQSNNYSSTQYILGDTSPREPQSSGSRPRTRTLDERRPRDISPSRRLTHQRNRVGSVSTSSAEYEGRDFLASVPAATSPPSAPSLSSLGSPVQMPSDPIVDARSISSMSSRSTLAESIASALPPASARRIQHLIKTLQGRMSGNVLFRKGPSRAWISSYCYIQEDTRTLMYESQSDGAHKVLIPDLRGCTMSLDMDGEVPYIELSPAQSHVEVHMKLSSQAEFDSWYAALRFWKDPSAIQDVKSQSLAPTPSPTMSDAPLPRTASASAQTRPRTDSGRSARRQSMGSTLKEAPVIKIGKMVFWDTNVAYSNTATGSTPIGHISNPNSRPSTHRMQSGGSRRWRRISGQLRENGELKLYSDADNTLVSVVQLSQLSRCAVQRLDSSVLDNDYCIAIYPQYVSGPNSSSTVLRPMFLSLENRVLYEVWFVLLRAFTIPQLYGPRSPQGIDFDGEDEPQDLESMLATEPTDMFRMERSLHIRIVEAKMYQTPTSPDPGEEFASAAKHARAAADASRSEHQGYHVEVMLDDETRARTSVKFDSMNPLWGESFEFTDLPAVLRSASVVIKRRRPPDRANPRSEYESRLIQEAYGFGDDSAFGGYTPQIYDTTCGKVEIYLEELEAAKEVERWWPAVNMFNQRVGEILIRARAEENIVLMGRNYSALSDPLHRFSNGLTLQIAQLIPSELKRLSDCLLNVYQVSGRAGDWLMSLIEDEIDGITKENSISKLRFSKRLGSSPNEEGESRASGLRRNDRELIVRDLNKNATLEANLLFRGNTLLTKSLDTHMRRVGKEYLEEALGPILRDINERDPDCEVDPNKVANAHEVDRNWKKLLAYTQRVWNAISATRQRCPIELRIIFRHIRACAEDRYGDFLRSVSYSSVSGFLFLRFYCPAVLNPTLFALVKADVKPHARRTFTLIAKSLQTLANMASFGNKEPWMEQMNTFLTTHRESFKSFIDDVCYVPSTASSYSTSSSVASSTTSSPTWPSAFRPGLPPGVVSAEAQLSYTTPMTIMQRLPPSSREGFPSLPYLIDQARAFADLVQLWLEASMSRSIDDNSSPASIEEAVRKQGGDLLLFHENCKMLHERTQQCLLRAERAERPHSSYSFKWDELLDQLHDKPDNADEPLGKSSFDKVLGTAEELAITEADIKASLALASLHSSVSVHDEDAAATKMYDSTSPSTASFDRPAGSRGSSAHGGGSTAQALKASKRHSMHHPPRGFVAGSSAAEDQPRTRASQVSFSSDTEASASTTALPRYENRAQQQQYATPPAVQEVQRRRQKEREREKSRVKTLVPALRKRRDRDRDKLERTDQGWLG